MSQDQDAVGAKSPLLGHKAVPQDGSLSPRSFEPTIAPGGTISSLADTLGQSIVHETVSAITLNVFGVPNNEPGHIFLRQRGVPKETFQETSPKAFQAYMTRTLSPMGNLHLEVHLDRYISHGHNSIVYEASTYVLDKDGVSRVELGPSHHPPLAAKISWPGRYEELWHEAAMYEEIDSFQREENSVLVAPRCYGLFTGYVQRPLSIIPPQSSQHPPEVYGHRQDEHESEIQMFKKPRLYPEQSHPRRDRINGEISILLLERMEKHLPFGVPMDESLKEEVHALYKELAKRRIEHEEECVRSGWNIMFALPSHPQDNVEPSTQKANRLRAIDFATSGWPNDGAYSTWLEEWTIQWANDMLEDREQEDDPEEPPPKPRNWAAQEFLSDGDDDEADDDEADDDEADDDDQEVPE